jgi:teichoic acid ribitol-phosphate primase
MSDLVVRARIALVRIGFALGSLLPLRPRVVLATAHADQIGGNLAAIRDALRRGQDTPIVAVAHRPASGLRGKIRAAWQAIVAGFLLATSRLFVVDDYYFPIYAIRPRPGTTIVQAWHASGAFKKFGHSLAGKSFGADASVLRHVRIHANYDVCLVSSERFIPHYADAFALPADRFTARIGIPRTDPLLDPAWRERTEAEVRARHGLTDGRRIVLYAPTFRGERTTEARFAAGLDLELVARELGDTHRLLLRLHPFIRDRVELAAAHRDVVIDASDDPDIHPLMLVADALVTDYSSVIFEYSLLDRPMAFFAPDHAAYERERGFYFEYATGVPGPVFTRTDELVAWLRAGPSDEDLARVRRFREEAFDVADGRASDRFVELVARPGLEGRG